MAYTRTLYDEVACEAMSRLAHPVRDFHRAGFGDRYSGRASVVRGRNPLSRLIAAVIGLPGESADCQVSIAISPDFCDREIWSRRFADRPFVSTQEAGRGRWKGLIVERIGPMAFAYGYRAIDNAGHLELRGWSAMGIPMPSALGPTVTAFEHGSDDRFNFLVDMSLPIIGRLVRYEGWLEPEAGALEPDLS